MLRKRAFIALMVMTITVTFCFVSWSEPNPQQAISQGKGGKLSAQKRSNQEKPTTDIVTPQILVDAISRAIDASAQKTKTTQNPPTPDNSTWLFSLFLVIFTGVLAIVAIFQFFVLRKTLEATTVAADAAKGSVDAFQAIERAKLFVRVERDPPPKQGELIENIKEGNNRVRIIIINEGKSVAILTKINWHVGVMDDREIDDKISQLGSNPASEFPYGVITIRRDGTKKIPVGCNITKSDLHKIDESTAYYVCLGQIKYKDVFRNVRPIVFCWKDDGTFFGPDPDPTRNYGT